MSGELLNSCSFGPWLSHRKYVSSVFLQSSTFRVSQLNVAVVIIIILQVNVIQDLSAFRILAPRAKPDAIVVDTSVPDVAAAIKELSAELACEQTRWVGSSADAETRATMNADGWLNRPYSIDELLSTLDAVFSNAGSANLEETTACHS